MIVFTIYRIFTIICIPVIIFYIKFREAVKKEDSDRINERFGISVIIRPKGKLIWLHAASVGESISMLPLVTKLLSDNPSINLMLTTGTISSARIMKNRLPTGAFHQYIPIDRPNYVKRFINHWKPDIVLWAESEFWPNTIFEVNKHNIPLILVNGRISDKSFQKWQRIPSLIRAILSWFSLCLGQSTQDTTRLKFLGAINTKCLGNLKFAADKLPFDQENLILLKKQIGTRPCWLAASTHPGEEESIVAAHKRIKEMHPNLLTIIVPRHPGRGPKIFQNLIKIADGVRLRSTGGQITKESDIYVADTFGELGLFYRLTETVFIGKSLIPLGGQNPIEALKLNCAVIHGPHMTNFQWVCEEMLKFGCALPIANAKNLAETVSDLLSNHSKRA